MSGTATGDPNRWRRIEPILDRLFDAETTDRAAILDEACAGDAELRRAVEALIEADASDVGPLASAEDDRLGALLQSVEPPAELDADDGEDRRIEGHRIARRIGSGGMGVVYEAEREATGERVALKILPRWLAPSERAARRFTREMWIAARLDHPDIVKVLEQGSWEGLGYYTMELVDGGSVLELIRNLRATGRDDRWRLEFGSPGYRDWVLARGIGVARALAHVHRHGVIHRDVKPGNLLLDRGSGRIRIADFGLALEPASSGPAGRLTTEGRVLGTPTYMAPEQIEARRDEVDGRTDVYSLAFTLFELLTLELPLAGATDELREMAPAPGATLEVVLRKALRSNPAERHATADAFADELERVLQGTQRSGVVSRWLSRLHRRFGR